MKIARALVALGITLASLACATAASAQPSHRRCHTEYRHHHHVRVCR